MEIRNGNSSSHVENKINKSRQSFYGLGNIVMLYPGATPGVQAYLYKSICQPTLTLSLAGHYYPDLPVLAAILIDL